MSEEQSATQKDVEKQVPLKESDFVESLETVKEKRIHGISAAGILIYLIFAAHFAIGVVSLEQCSVNQMIPIYLAVAGALGIIIRLLTDTTNKYLFSTLIVLVSGYCVWHILGTYFVYREHESIFDFRSNQYCSKLAYYSAFWSLTLQYTFFIFFVLLSICRYMMKHDFT